MSAKTIRQMCSTDCVCRTFYNLPNVPCALGPRTLPRPNDLLQFPAPIFSNNMLVSRSPIHFRSGLDWRGSWCWVVSLKRVGHPPQPFSSRWIFDGPLCYPPYELASPTAPEVLTPAANFGTGGRAALGGFTSPMVSFASARPIGCCAESFFFFYPARLSSRLPPPLRCERAV